MSETHPTKGIAKKTKVVQSADDTAITTAAKITVPANQYAAIYFLHVSCDVLDEADIENLNAVVVVSVLIGGTAVFTTDIHPFSAETTATKGDIYDLGPWHFDFGHDGLYSGVKGEDLTFSIGQFGTGIKSRISFKYTGD
jgi:hypothetical protein